MTRVKPTPSIRTYYLLFDGKTLVTKRPDVKVKAVQRATSVADAREKLAKRFVLAMGRFRGRITQTSRPLPTGQPSMQERVRKMAAADARNSEPLDLGEVLELASKVPELPGVVPVRVSTHGITLVVAEGSYVDVSAKAAITILPQAPPMSIPTEEPLDLAAVLN